MPRNEEFDWIFDFALQFLESDRFDCAIMDFVDEKCIVFEDEEENKLIYTEIHREFCEHVEALINSNLGELGVTPEVFLESCEKAREGRDINATVFERLIAMDDFQTFKKLMTKRNLELQLESIHEFQMLQNTPFSQSLKTSRRAEGKDQDYDNDEDDENDKSFAALLDPEELLALKEAQLVEFDDGNLQDQQLQELLFQSLMEMEFIHRQEELEHAELERALLLSLAAEEERLKLMVTECLMSPVLNPSEEKASYSPPQDRKAESDGGSKETAVENKREKDSKDEKEDYISAPVAASTISHTSPPKKKIVQSVPKMDPDAFADIKPLNLKPLRSALPLPSMNLAKAVSGDPQAEKLAEELEEKRRATEEALRKSQMQLQNQKRTEEELRKQVSGIDPNEAERRAQHMREQRELLLAKKKAEREKRVQAEEERKRKQEGKEEIPIISPVKSVDEEKSEPGEDEMKRAMLRAALARRLKMDLLEDNNDTKSTQNPLRQLDQLREDNRKREQILSTQLQKQQDKLKNL